MLYHEPIERLELDELLAADGAATSLVELLDVEIDEDLYTKRFLKSTDRRGEVVFAVHGSQGGTLVHRKPFYPERTYRLPTGGINYGERVWDALRRELMEEMSLTIVSAHFVGVQDCGLRYHGHQVRFVSYVFHVHQTTGELHPDEEEGISEIREVSPVELAAIAAGLRQTPVPFTDWGRWRALAHDMVYRHLIEHKPS